MTLVMHGPGKNQREHAAVSRVQIANHDPRAEPLGFQFQQEQVHGLVTMLRVEFERQEVGTVSLDGEIGVAPDRAWPLPMWPDRRRGTHPHPLVIQADHAAGAHGAEVGAQAQRRRADRSDPVVDGGRTHAEHAGTAALSREQGGVDLDGQEPHLDRIGRVGQVAEGQRGEGVVGTVGVEAVIALDFHDLLGTGSIHDGFEPRLLALGGGVRTSTVRAADWRRGREGWRDRGVKQGLVHGVGQRARCGLGGFFLGFQAQWLDTHLTVVQVSRPVLGG